ncbi:isopentenyl-diphosphate Delta-isomerase [Roseovarius faecimaris]|uniref:Isopentenyl-diphosphate Delta-isomerase n=1 Tax=Roseovarius faecimaris TaxID=2494550 RepID=A0A6I6IYU5_9RHOB|nr:isopentenyl-diphosphate Delta-isomerase [Roseovarius faecimaris]QGX97778.1 isopentenyl-diphosphate Delta-isomerase [Roseovarius faecimaris]
MTALIPAWIGGDLVAVEKLDVHERGLKHKAVSVFVLSGTKVLIQQRAMGKYHTPGLWANTCCTHPHWGERAEDCAVRRLQEELGLTVPRLSYRDQVEYRANVGGGLTEHELVDVFVSHVADPVTVSPNPDEVMDTAWVEMEELRRHILDAPARYTPWLKIYMLEHADQIFAGSSELLGVY